MKLLGRFPGKRVKGKVFLHIATVKDLKTVVPPSGKIFLLPDPIFFSERCLNVDNKDQPGMFTIHSYLML